jgi:hypothetical protein
MERSREYGRKRIELRATVIFGVATLALLRLFLDYASHAKPDPARDDASDFNRLNVIGQLDLIADFETEWLNPSWHVIPDSQYGRYT